ncbi:GNAT family N-acetyltransferase [Photobacterium satsumensis]|uniref:GNAT family N-acetyltransferase n=1 Tax=Photobacterium satsumensis TaxID=2910239 RepID=UPI003D142A50
MKLIQCKRDSANLNELELLIKSEWSDFTFDGYSSGLPYPLAATSNEKIIGGVAFTLYKHPCTDNEVVWINALIVLPEYQGKGIARQLIETALLDVAKLGGNEVFAYTETPAFYQALGWSEVEAVTESENKVMGLVLKA